MELLKLVQHDKSRFISDAKHPFHPRAAFIVVVEVESEMLKQVQHDKITFNLSSMTKIQFI